MKLRCRVFSATKPLFQLQVWIRMYTFLSSPHPIYVATILSQYQYKLCEHQVLILLLEPLSNLLISLAMSLAFCSAMPLPIISECPGIFTNFTSCELSTSYHIWAGTHTFSGVFACLEIQDAKMTLKFAIWANFVGRAMFLQRRRVSTIGKNLLNSNISSTCPHNMVNFSLLTSEIGSLVWGTPANFNGFRILASLLHRRRSPEANQILHDVWPSHGLVHYIYIFGGSCPLAEFY